jgi:hypothetical protein
MTLAVTDLLAFNETAFLAAVEAAAGGGNSAAIASIAYKVKFSTVITAVITELQGRTMLSTTLSADLANVAADVTYSRRLLEEAAADKSDNLNEEDMQRRLQAYTSSSVDGTITSSSAAAAHAFKTAASDPNVSSAMVNHLSTAEGISATATVGAVTSEVEVVTIITSQSGAAVPEFSGDVAGNLTANIAAMPGGATLSALTDTTPTPSPTVAPGTPTVTPTAAPPPTAAPTVAPTAVPTVAPTAASGGSSNDEEDSACAMGAKALALTAAAFVLRLSH